MNGVEDLPFLIDPAELRPHLQTPDLRVIDLSPPSEYAGGHVPGAIHLPYTRIVRHAPPVAGLLPGRATLQSLYNELGIRSDTNVVALDAEGGAAAGRLLWTLHYLGHERCALLDGGMTAWRAAGLPVESRTAPQPAPADNGCNLNDDVVADAAYILDRLDDPDFRLLDARSDGEFEGTIRRAMHAGRIPGARHYEWTRAIDPGTSRMRPRVELLDELASLDVTPEHEVTVYCHSHHRSSFSYCMLKVLGFPRVRGYPGSWSDWGNRDDLPVETSE